MTELKLKIKKSKLIRKIDGEKKEGYYGRVITSGKATFDEIARESAKNTTLHPKEASLAAELLLERLRGDRTDDAPAVSIELPTSFVERGSLVPERQ